MHNGWQAATIDISTIKGSAGALATAAALMLNGHTLHGAWYVPITVSEIKGIIWNETQDEVYFATVAEAAIWFVRHCGVEAVTANMERLCL